MLFALSLSGGNGDGQVEGPKDSESFRTFAIGGWVSRWPVNERPFNRPLDSIAKGRGPEEGRDCDGAFSNGLI